MLWIIRALRIWIHIWSILECIRIRCYCISCIKMIDINSFFGFDFFIPSALNKMDDILFQASFVIRCFGKRFLMHSLLISFAIGQFYLLHHIGFNQHRFFNQFENRISQEFEIGSELPFTTALVWRYNRTFNKPKWYRGWEIVNPLLE